jgi:hypothetical protein
VESGVRLTNEQIVAITAPMVFNGVIIGLVVLWMRAKFDAIDRRFDAEASGINARFDAINQRFDDLKDWWRAELRRVEEILDARLKHLEQR